MAQPRRHGVSPWWFLFIDVVSAPPYGLSQAVAVKILRDENMLWRDSVPWILVVIITFLAPYVFVVVVAGEIPLLAYLGIALWMSVFGALAAFRMFKQVRAELPISEERANV